METAMETAMGTAMGTAMAMETAMEMVAQVALNPKTTARSKGRMTTSHHQDPTPAESVTRCIHSRAKSLKR